MGQSTVFVVAVDFFSITWQKRTRSPAGRCSGNEAKLPPTTPLLGKQKDGI